MDLAIAIEFMIIFTFFPIETFFSVRRETLRSETQPTKRVSRNPNGVGIGS